MAGFNFSSGRGWNGPYLIDAGNRYGNFTDPSDSDNFTTDYGSDADPAVLDGWGKPIILQEASTQNARLVSAGVDGVLETDPNDPLASRGDDLVRFLLSVDPNI